MTAVMAGVARIFARGELIGVVLFRGLMIVLLKGLALKPHASLRLVSSGEVTDDVTLFFPQKVMTFFGHHHHSHPLRLPSDHLSFVQCFFCKFSCKKIRLLLGRHPWMVSPGADVKPSNSEQICLAFWHSGGDDTCASSGYACGCH